MADVYSITPRVERVMRNVEKTCKRYDNTIVSSIWLTVAFIAWMIVADTAIGSSSVVYNGTWDSTKPAADIDTTYSRADNRTYYRVLRVLEEQCKHSDYQQSVVVAPQVHVNGSPYMKRVVRLCTGAIELVNPVIAFQGDNYGVCIDEHDGFTKRSSRRYPLAVHALGNMVHTIEDIENVCSFMHAMDLLDARWQA